MIPHGCAYFYPRPPRGGRRKQTGQRDCTNVISIHALREEGDVQQTEQPKPEEKFLSTPSARRATRCALPVLCSSADFYPRPPRGGRRLVQSVTIPSPIISIHALREEGDMLATTKARSTSKFLSTPSARRATLHFKSPYLRGHISIHALREEGDERRGDSPAVEHHFYPRPPRGGRPLRTAGR